MKPFERIIRRIVSVLMYISMGALTTMMFLGSTDVIGRYIFNKPIFGTYVIFAILLPIMVFMGAAYTQMEEEHVKITLLTSVFTKRVQAILGTVTTFIAFVLFLLIFWRGTVAVIAAYHSGRHLMNINIPIYMVQILVPLGALSMLPVFISQMLRFISQIKTRRDN